jgi:hypothetical protein
VLVCESHSIYPSIGPWTCAMTTNNMYTGVIDIKALKPLGEIREEMAARALTQEMTRLEGQTLPVDSRTY